MQPQISNENRARFNAQYLKSEARSGKGETATHKVVDPISCSVSGCVLLLRPLSDITKEEGRMLSKKGKEAIKHPSFRPVLCQLGFCLPFTCIQDGEVITYSIEDLVQMGLVELVGKEGKSGN